MHTLRAIMATRPGSRSPVNRRQIRTGVYRTTLRNAAVAVALAGAAVTAHAGIRASAVNPGWWYQTAAEAYVPLTAAGAVTLTFNLASAGKKVLTFSAACMVWTSSADIVDAFLDLDIYVNGLRVAPTTGTNPFPDDAFCSNGYSPQGVVGATRASITVPIQGQAGQNAVQIKARGQNGATALYLARTSLVIQD